MSSRILPKKGQPSAACVCPVSYFVIDVWIEYSISKNQKQYFNFSPPYLTSYCIYIRVQSGFMCSCQQSCRALKVETSLFLIRSFESMTEAEKSPKKLIYSKHLNFNHIRYWSTDYRDVKLAFFQCPQIV